MDKLLPSGTSIWAICLFIGLGIVGCGEDSDSEGGQSNFSIEGEWRGDCLQLGGPWYIVGSLSNTDANSDSTLSYYLDDPSCETLLFEDTTTRTYSLGKAIEGESAGYEIDYTVIQVQRVYRNQTSADAANTDKAYGFSDWAVGTPKETTGLQSGPDVEAEWNAGDMFYNLVAVESDMLTVGDTLDGKDGLSAENRPTELSSKLIFTKQ